MAPPIAVGRSQARRTAGAGHNRRLSCRTGWSWRSPSWLLMLRVNFDFQLGLNSNAAVSIAFSAEADLMY